MDVVKAAPDGYTLGYGNIVSLAINRSLLAKVPYEVEKDLSLISNCVRVFNLLAVNNKLPVRSVQDLIDHARRNPGRLVMASGGNGTTGHLGGEVHLMFDNISSIGAHARAGRVRGIAVSGPRRSPLFPELPTLHEAGVTGYETVAWGGVIGPANLPRDIVAALHAEIRKALSSPFVLERFRQLDTDADGGTPEEFLALVRSETPKWAEVVKRSGAKVD
jgi:tripartite-type tricarboxylate transporter receptor subunit TctC